MASEKILEQKKKIVDDLAAKIKASCAGVLVSYEGITVEDDTRLRAELRKSGVEYSVIKNTLASKAFDIVGYHDLKQYLSGMTAFAFSEKDEISAAKILEKYASDHETFLIKGGFVDGEVIDGAGLTALAKTPAKEVLIAKMLGSMQSSLYGLCYAIQAIIDKSGEAAPAEAAAE